MIEVVLFGLTSFGVGLSGALVPGPMLTVTISDSIKKGFIAGPLVILGHFIAEIAVIIAVLAGLDWVIGSQTSSIFIGTLGGAVLISMGYDIFKSKENLSDILSGENKTKTHGSVLGGIITSFSNPYFFIWWASIGYAFMYKGLELAGILGLLGFLIGHWCADLSWYSLISLFSSQGTKIMKDSTYKLVMNACGVFLIILGMYFITGVLRII